jgi:hypothetical protein
MKFIEIVAEIVPGMVPDDLFQTPEHGFETG